MSEPIVYIIDDDIEQNKVLEYYFFGIGCLVEVFINFKDFKMRYLEQKPDLILTDIYFEEDGPLGYDIIRFTRKNSKHSMPIIVLSSDHNLKHVTHALEIGANDYLIKPALKSGLESTVSKYIQPINIPATSNLSFSRVRADKQQIKMLISLKIIEIHHSGFLLLSDHLLKIGSELYLSGNAIKECCSNSSKVLVRVINSTMTIIHDSKKYLSQVEINAEDQISLEGIRNFLDIKFNIEK